MITLTALTDSPHPTDDAPYAGSARMARLDRLMECREDAYRAMRAMVPDLAGSPVHRRALTPTQRRATQRFDNLNELVRAFRSGDDQDDLLS